MTSRRSSRGSGSKIDKLDFDAHRRRPSSSSHGSQHSHDHNLLSSNESFFSDVVSGAIARDRATLSRRITKIISFVCAILNCLCAGSITAYSVYAPLFISHLRYSQYQVNAVSTTAELGMYLPVPLAGWLCDRYSPRPLSLASAILFGGGYALAAGVYRAGPNVKEVELHKPGREQAMDTQQHGWPFSVMILAFVLVGSGTVSMYMSAVTTCAKNFGRGKHKGLALGAPIAAFGLSGMWQSQVGSHFFKERGTDDMDAARYFVFLAALQFTVGVIGSLGLRVVDEDSLIEDAVNDLERSGLLSHDAAHDSEAAHHRDANTYGTISRSSSSPSRSPSPSPSHLTPTTLKTNVLNAETRLFLTDPTMWLLTLGFFLTSGPGETYQNNVGTLLHTAYAPSTPIPSHNTPATHVSLIAITSTLARLITGTISDVLAPSNSIRKSCTVSRLTFLLVSTGLFSLAQLLLATPLPSKHPGIFPLCSSLVGLGYGAIFSLVPIIVSVVWGVENFGTNWGLVAVVPAPGAAVWGAVYSAVYDGGIRKRAAKMMGKLAGDAWTLGSESREGSAKQVEGQCLGRQCYQSTFLAMAIASWVAMALWTVAWRRWKRRGVAV